MKSLLLFGACVLLSACGSTTEDEASSEDAVRVSAASFKLYETPRVIPVKGCDIFTALDLDATSTLEERLDGNCKIRVIPDTRSYRLRFDHTSCGSRIYTGVSTQPGSRATIIVTDHRTRLCRDLVPSKVIVEEHRLGQTVTKYSFDGSFGQRSP